MLSQAVLFDFDFTLCDSSAAHLDSVRTALEEVGAPIPSDDAILATTASFAEAFERFAPHHPTADLVRRAEARLDTSFLPLARLYEPVPAVVTELHARGYRLGIISMKRAHRIDALLTHAGLRAAFGIIVGGDSVVQRKPHPEGIELVMRSLGATPATTIYVGDNLIDFHTAQAANVPFIAVLTGATTRAEFHAHSIAHILEDVASLPFVLRQD